MKPCHKQNGFVIMLFIVVVVIIASLWLSTKHEKLISMFKNEQIESGVEDLVEVKERLLQFAILQPELYMTADDDGDGTYDERDAGSIPSPGYLPCPDLDGDGTLLGNETNCGNPFDDGLNANDPSDDDLSTGFVPKPDRNEGVANCNGGVCLGYVPQKISTRNFYFAPKKKYFYFIDERYSFSNQNNYPTPDYANRFAPLYPNKLDPSLTNNPGLTLDGQKGYVALIVDPGEDGVLDAENSNGDSIFISNASQLFSAASNDRVVGISYDEWFWVVAQRICMEYDRLELVDENRSHWFNDYRDNSSTYEDPNTGAIIPNPNVGGSSWRSWGVVCK